MGVDGGGGGYLVMATVFTPLHGSGPSVKEGPLCVGRVNEKDDDTTVVVPEECDWVWSSKHTSLCFETLKGRLSSCWFSSKLWSWYYNFPLVFDLNEKLLQA